MSFFAIYKPNQGFATRVVTGAAAALLVAWGIYWLCDELSTLRPTVASTAVLQIDAAKLGSEPLTLEGLGIKLKTPDAAEQPSDDTPTLAVTSVNYVAKQAGLQTRDVITHIGAVPVSARDELIKALRQAEPSAGLELTVGRRRSILLYVQAASAVATALVFAALLWWILNKPRVVDFMIATESEMRKVNWPTRREIIGSTWLVICGTLLMALLLFTVDIGFALLFRSIGVLEGG